MASFRGHLATSAGLGVIYGGAACLRLEIEVAPAILGAGLTALGGLLPDLDSDSSVPNRTLFQLAGGGVAFLAFRQVLATSSSIPEGVFMIAAAYLGVRYIVSVAFRRLTVHRGMFHSIPAMLISGLSVFLLYSHWEMKQRLFLAGGIMLGFLSHLVLDEICAVDFRGARLKKPFGTALKLYSPSWPATMICYLVLFTLAFLALN